jgi:hypothetical protein
MYEHLARAWEAEWSGRGRSISLHRCREEQQQQEHKQKRCRKGKQQQENLFKDYRKEQQTQKQMTEKVQEGGAVA